MHIGPSQDTTAGESVASELQLESFCVQPVKDRVLTPALRGVLAETALSGVIRYKWALVRPLVEFAMEEVILQLACSNMPLVSISACT